MKKLTLYSVLDVLYYICIGLFVGNTIRDAVNYNQMLNSAPFWVFILANAVTYLLPGVVFAGLAYYFKKKQNNKISRGTLY